MEAKKRHSHIQLAHSYWKNHLQNDSQHTSWAIDATCGNGHDTHFLAKICEGVISIDIQEKAIENAKQTAESSNIFYFCQSHENYPTLAYENPISLIVYNLGYLPGGDKGLTTLTPSTLSSLELAMDLLASGGLISITCYPGHLEGKAEEKALISLAEGLDVKLWNVCHHRWLNRKDAPSLLLLQKNPIN